MPGISDDERLEISTNEGKCFRIFNCVDDKPVPYSEYSCEISDIKGDWWGEHFYQDGLPVLFSTGTWVTPRAARCPPGT